MQQIDPARAPIFIVGIGRSGTTLLRLMLCAHPRIYIAHEASFYVAEALYAQTAPGRELLEQYMQSRSFRWLGVDPARVRAAVPDPLPRAELRLAYTEMMRARAEQFGRVRFGDKTPANSAYLDRIFRDYPEARVIRVTRDPRANVESLMRVPFGSASVVASATLIDVERKRVQPYRGRILTVRLEDLLADGRKTMTRVLEHIGEPWDDAVLDHSRHLPDADDMPPQPWLSGATGERKAGPRAQTLSPRQIRLIEQITRGSMEEGGYTRAALDREPSWLEVQAQRVRELPEALRYYGVGLRFIRRGRTKIAEDETSDAILRELNPSSWSRYPSLGGRLLPEPPARS